MKHTNKTKQKLFFYNLRVDQDINKVREKAEAKMAKQGYRLEAIQKVYLHPMSATPMHGLVFLGIKNSVDSLISED